MRRDSDVVVPETPPTLSPVPAAAADPVAGRRADGPLVLGGRYEVGRLLGSGGTASVHAARDLLLGREVAVKLFRQDAGASPELRLHEIEARIVASLNHPALTTLLDAGVEAGDTDAPRVYLVMEYVRGSTLRDRLRTGPLSVAEACWLGFDLAEGLDSMHQVGFLHRDVKPANVLISDHRSARPVVAKLTDFGIAAAIGQPDLSEYTVGTAAYLSPEQVEGRDARPESDTYSLGLVLLEAITGRIVFPGSVEESAFARLLRDPDVPPEVPAPVASLLRRMTVRDPGARVPLHEVALELQQFLVDDLVRRRTGPARIEPAPAPAPVLPDAPDGAPDPVFDALVRVTARALAAQQVVLLLTDGTRTRVQARLGEVLDPPPADLLDRLVAAPNGAEPWTPDGWHPEASAAAAPLIAHGGRRIGALAVLCAPGRTFDAEDLASLSDIAGLAVHEIELRSAARRVALDAS